MPRILESLRDFGRNLSSISVQTWVRGLAVLVLFSGAAGLFMYFADLSPLVSEDAAGHEAQLWEIPSMQMACPPAHLLRKKVSKDVLQFEEALGSPVEEKAKMVDYAILEGLILSGLDPGLLRIDDVGPAPQPAPLPAAAGKGQPQSAASGGAGLHFQRIVVRSEAPPPQFLDFLAKELRQLDCQASLEQVNATTWGVSLMQRPTHELLFQAPSLHPEPRPTLQPPAPAARGLVIVMDDLGLERRFARELAALPEPVSFSVLPWLPHTEEVAAIAREHGKELLLHQPMEPLDSTISPGAGALFAGAPQSRVRQLVRENLTRLPGAVGLNNHMGSRFTQDPAGVDAVLDVAAENGVFVLDSVTHPGSVLAKRALQRGVPVLRRDIFLDVVKDTGAILYQLRKAERIAGRRGQAVAIGHPYPETLEALRIWSREREARAERVPVVTAQALALATSGMLAGKSKEEQGGDEQPLAQNVKSR